MSGDGDPAPRSLQLRKERQAAWRELETLVAAAERNGLRRLTPEQLGRLAVLYRATLSSLAVARSVSLDRNALAYLESLAARAYFLVYGPKRRMRDLAAEFVTSRFPATVRGAGGAIAMSAGFMLLGAVVAYAMTMRDPDRFYGFVASEYAQGRGPTSSTESLRKVLYETDKSGHGGLAAFASYLFSHNAQVGITAFALGFAAGVPVFLLLFVNGLILGAFAALYQSRGLGAEFWAWVLPHGVTELLAVVLCGAAGLTLAQALLFPGTHTRLDNLKRRGREAGTIVLGAVMLFCVAASIEGFFRQLVQAPEIRWTTAALTAVMWVGYFGFAGRGRTA